MLDSRADRLMRIAMRHTFFLNLLFGICFALLPGELIAEDYVKPGDVAVKTKAYSAPSNTNFPTGTYNYSVSWQGVPVASANVIVERDSVNQEGLFHVQANAKTAKGISWIYKLRHHSESVFEANSFKPLRFSSWQRENSRHRLREVTFDTNGEIEAKRWKNGKEKPSERFTTDNLTLDPLSAAFLARSLPIEIGSTKTFDVFNGKHRYLITFKVASRERIKLNKGEVRDAFKVIPSVEKLTSSDKREPKLKSATIWISADKRRDVLKLESKVWVGKVAAKLVRFLPEDPIDSLDKNRMHVRVDRVRKIGTN